MNVSRRALLTSAAAGVAFAALSAAPAFAGEKSPGCRTIHVAGDSTAADKSIVVKPEAGWAMALPYFATSHLRVRNHARSGRSSKSFIDEGRLQKIVDEIAPGDVLLAQFGHNDQKSADPALYTEPWSTYQEHLAQYVDAARRAGARPVLATPIERRRFDSSGNAYESHGEYPAAVRELAARLDVPLIDAHAESLSLWQALGPEETKRYFLYTEDGRKDNTHLQTTGASAIARIVGKALRDTRVLERRELHRLGSDVPFDWFVWPEREDMEP